MQAAMLHELYDEEVELPYPVEVLPHLEDAQVQALELAQVRRMLIRLRQLQADQEQAVATKRAVVATYDDRIATLDTQIDALKEGLLSVLVRGPHGTKLTFPDAGRINLSTAGGNVVLDSKEEAVTAHGYMFTRPVVDEAAMNSWAREYTKEHGQPPKGYAVAPRRKVLVVAKP